MVSPDQADREEQLAYVQEGTEQRMHSAADLLPDSELVHERADQLSARAQSTDVQPNGFGRVLPQMRTPGGERP